MVQGEERVLRLVGSTLPVLLNVRLLFDRLNTDGNASLGPGTAGVAWIFFP
jgi:hypothetical protein